MIMSSKSKLQGKAKAKPDQDILRLLSQVSEAINNQGILLTTILSLLIEKGVLNGIEVSEAFNVNISACADDNVDISKLSHTLDGLSGSQVLEK